MDKQHPPARVTFDEAMANAARLLQQAENEFDLVKMELATELGHCWIDYAGLVHDRERI